MKAPQLGAFRTLEVISPGCAGVGKPVMGGPAVNLFNPFGSAAIPRDRLVNAIWQEGRWVINNPEDQDASRTQ